VLAAAARRKYTTLDLINTALRDGFIDRYTGKRLVFPGTLRLLSVLMPAQVPYRRTGRTTATTRCTGSCTPRSTTSFPLRGVASTSRNWVTASQRTNCAKAHWTLDELGWRLLPASDVGAWDGLTRWFLKFTDSRPELALGHKAVRVWSVIARRALSARDPFEEATADRSRHSDLDRS
jgi:hypothetical protein